MSTWRQFWRAVDSFWQHQQDAFVRLRYSELEKRGAHVKKKPDRSRARRARGRISRGLHPTGVRLLTEPKGESCGGCVHAWRKEWQPGRFFWKCKLRGDTNGGATDIRKGWPACEQWKPKQETPKNEDTAESRENGSGSSA